MAHIVVLGAGLGGTIMAFEMKEKMRPEDRLTVVNQGSTYLFVSSNPWIAVGWRDRKDITVDLSAVFSRRGIALRPEGARRVHPAENRVELNDDSFLDYDYLIVATGPELAFDEVQGLGPSGRTQSICQIDHAAETKTAFEALVKAPGRWSSGPPRVRPVSVPPMNSPSSSIRRYAMRRSATACQ